MGNLALPCGSLTPLMPTNLVSVRQFFFTAIAAIRLPRHHVNDRLSVRTTQAQTNECHCDSPERLLRITSE